MLAMIKLMNVSLLGLSGILIVMQSSRLFLSESRASVLGVGVVAGRRENRGRGLRGSARARWRRDLPEPLAGQKLSHSHLSATSTTVAISSRSQCLLQIGVGAMVHIMPSSHDSPLFGHTKLPSCHQQPSNSSSTSNISTSSSTSPKLPNNHTTSTTQKFLY